jgi:hypothetical protein
MEITEEFRGKLNALVLKGQTDAARCVEKLMLDGETVVLVRVGGGHPRIDITPPTPASPLWRNSVAYKVTPATLTFIAIRFGCSIIWTVDRAQVEPQRRMNG